MMHLVLRCADAESAVASLASLFSVAPTAIERALPIAVSAAAADRDDPIRAAFTALVAEVDGDFERPDMVHYFHGTRTRDPTVYLRHGLQPLSSTLDGIWTDLISLLPGHLVQDAQQLRAELESQPIEPHTYGLRVEDSMHHGPCGHLVRDALLHPGEYHTVDYLAGSEIATDICEAMRDRLGVEVATRHRARAVPCIVEFALPATKVEDAVAATVWYAYSALRGEHSANANWGYDGGGVAIPARAIVGVETPGAGSLA